MSLTSGSGDTATDTSDDTSTQDSGSELTERDQGSTSSGSTSSGGFTGSTGVTSGSGRTAGDTGTSGGPSSGGTSGSGSDDLGTGVTSGSGDTATSGGSSADAEEELAERDEGGGSSDDGPREAGAGLASGSGDVATEAPDDPSSPVTTTGPAGFGLASGGGGTATGLAGRRPGGDDGNVGAAARELVDETLEIGYERRGGRLGRAARRVEQDVIDEQGWAESPEDVVIRLEGDEFVWGPSRSRLVSATEEQLREMRRGAASRPAGDPGPGLGSGSGDVATSTPPLDLAPRDMEFAVGDGVSLVPKASAVERELEERRAAAAGSPVPSGDEGWQTGGGGLRGAVDRQIFQGEAVDFWTEKSDPGVADTLTSTRGWFPEEQEETIREKRDKAGQPFIDFAPTAERRVKRFFGGSDKAGRAGGGIWTFAGDVAMLPGNAFLLADTATEAAVQAPESVDEHGARDTALTVSAAVGTAGAGAVSEAAQNPYRSATELTLGFGAGTAGVRVLEKTGDVARGSVVKSKADRPEVTLEDVTDETGTAGGLPREANPAAPPSRRVQHYEELSRSNPEAVKPSGSEGAMFHTTRGRFNRDLDVGEGASEYPGLWASPEASAIGLDVGGGGYSLAPRMPRFWKRDRVVSLPEGGVRHAPPGAKGAAYEVRDVDTGEQVTGGLGRGQAKGRAEGTDLEVRPDQTTPGYDFYKNRAEEGVPYLRSDPTGEMEAIYAPGSRFVQEGVTPVRIGGRSVPETVRLPGTGRSVGVPFGGRHVPGTGRVVPGQRFGRADGPEGRRSTDGPEGARRAGGDADDALSFYELPTSRAARKSGQPYTPLPTLSGSGSGGPSGGGTASAPGYGGSPSGASYDSVSVGFGSGGRTPGPSGPTGTPTGGSTGTPTGGSTGTPTGGSTGTPPGTPPGTPTGGGSRRPGYGGGEFGWRGSYTGGGGGDGGDDLAIGWVSETVAGFGGLGLPGGEGLRTSRESIEGQGEAPMGEFLPMLGAEEEERFEEAYDLLSFGGGDGGDGWL